MARQERTNEQRDADIAWNTKMIHSMVEVISVQAEAIAEIKRDVKMIKDHTTLRVE